MAAAASDQPAPSGLEQYLRPLRLLRHHKLTVTGAYVGTIGQTIVTLIIPQFVKWIVDSGIGGAPLHAGIPQWVANAIPPALAADTMGLVVASVTMLLLLSFVRGGFTYLTGVNSEVVSQSVAYRLRNALYHKLCSLSFRFHDQSTAGDLLSRAAQDVERLRFLTGRALLGIVNALFLMIATAAVLFAMDPLLAILAMLVIPPLTWQAWKFAKAYRPLSMEIQKQLGVLTTVLEQNLRGIRVVKAFAQEKAQVGAYNAANSVWFEHSADAAQMRSVRIPLLDLLAGLGRWCGLFRRTGSYQPVHVVGRTVGLHDLSGPADHADSTHGHDRSLRRHGRRIQRTGVRGSRYQVGHCGWRRHPTAAAHPGRHRIRSRLLQLHPRQPCHHRCLV